MGEITKSLNNPTLSVPVNVTATRMLNVLGTMQIPSENDIASNEQGEGLGESQDVAASDSALAQTAERTAAEAVQTSEVDAEASSATNTEAEAEESVADKPIEEMTEEEIKAMEEAEAARMAALQESYIVHTAMITCSYAARPSRVVIPISHGEYIHGIDQLNIGDSKPIINIQSFGVCRSPLNPTVQAAAAAIKAEVQNRKKSFMDKVMDFFSKKPSEDVGADLVKECAGVCTPIIAMEWIDGKEDVLIDGKPALLGRCKLQCGYDGEITMYTSGQME